MIDKEIEAIIARNVKFKDQLGWTYGTVMKAFNVCHSLDVESAEFVRLVKKYQAQKGLKADGILGPGTYAVIMSDQMTPKERAVKRVLDYTILHESGGLYTAMNLDGEFKGQFDKVWTARHGTPHPASGKIHIGLSFGVIQFTQDGGSLGKLLALSAKKNPERFKAIFGSTYDSLLLVLTASGASGLASKKERGPRVQKIRVAQGNEMVLKDIWESPWKEKFVAFGNEPEFQAVQRDLAISEYLDKIKPELEIHGYLSEKMVAAAFDGSVHRGVGGFRTLLKRIITEGKDKSEKAVLSRLAQVNNRFAKIINSPELSNDKWEGWEV